MFLLHLFRPCEFVFTWIVPRYRFALAAKYPVYCGRCFSYVSWRRGQAARAFAGCFQVKRQNPASEWIWGAFKLTGKHFSDLHELWIERHRSDEYLGTLVNAYLARGGSAFAVKRGDVYVDVGTLNGYREALRVLSNQGTIHELAS